MIFFLIINIIYFFLYYNNNIMMLYFLSHIYIETQRHRHYWYMRFCQERRRLRLHKQLSLVVVAAWCRIYAVGGTSMFAVRQL
jgi:hypothetical protein